MKNTLTKLAIALPLVLAATTSQATYTVRIAMETTGGGSLPAGSIVFNNKDDAPVGPVTPTEPEVVDPFEPENPDCDPLAQDNNPGKYFDFATNYTNDSGVKYRSCKLKDTGEPNLLAKFVSVIPTVSSYDNCDPTSSTTRVDTSRCEISAATLIGYSFKPSKDAGGNYLYTPLPMIVNMPSSVPLDSIGRYVIDGVECQNLRKVLVGYPGHYTEQPYRNCDYPVSYESLKAKKGKPYIVEIYGK